MSNIKSPNSGSPSVGQHYADSMAIQLKALKEIFLTATSQKFGPPIEKIQFIADAFNAPLKNSGDRFDIETEKLRYETMKVRLGFSGKSSLPSHIDIYLTRDDVFISENSHIIKLADDESLEPKIADWMFAQMPYDLSSRELARMDKFFDNMLGNQLGPVAKQEPK